jgi:hypothetical protein
VDLSGAVKLTQHSLHRLVEACPSLTSLNLTGCWFIEAQSLVELSSKVGRNLVSLTLDQLELDSRDLEKILAPCTRLRYLSLREMSNFSNRTWHEKASWLTESEIAPAWTWLHGMESLERLVASRLQVPVSVGKDIGHCTNLMSLTLEEGASYYTLEDSYYYRSKGLFILVPIFNTLHQLREWNMPGWQSMVDTRLERNLQAFGSRLLSLSLCGNSK